MGGKRMEAILRRPKIQRKIFALEGEWSPRMQKKLSVRTSLELVSELEQMPYLLRNVATAAGLHFFLRKASQKSMAHYNILYLAFHGKSGGICLGKQLITLEELAQSYPNKFQGKIIHFGACETLKIDETQLRYFKKATGASLVSGFHQRIDFSASTIFDIAYFSTLATYERAGWVKRQMEKDYPTLYRRLGFVIV